MRPERIKERDEEIDPPGICEDVVDFDSVVRVAGTLKLIWISNN